jgi:hypothetical protein
MRTMIMALGEHATDDRLEQYCLGRVPAAELEELESHLLMCPACQDRLRDSEAYVRTIQQATAYVAAHRLARRSWWRAWMDSLFRSVPVTAIAGAAALALVWGVGPSLRDAPPPRPVTVAVDLTRGGGDGLRVHAPFRRPLVLRLDLTGLPPLDSYRVQIVDRQGQSVLESAGRPDRGRLAMAVSRSLAQGSYWVRVYNPQAARTPLREFGLELE